METFWLLNGPQNYLEEDSLPPEVPDIPSVSVDWSEQNIGLLYSAKTELEAASWEVDVFTLLKTDTGGKTPKWTRLLVWTSHKKSLIFYTLNGSFSEITKVLDGVFLCNAV